MGKAIVAWTPEINVFGQSIGCIVPLPKTAVLGEVFAFCEKITQDRSTDRVSINCTSSHHDVPGTCISISFHLPSSAKRPTKAEMDSRVQLLQEWVRNLKMGVEEFGLPTFMSRPDFCRYMLDPLSLF